jgi:hypothetical protein
MVTPDRDQSLLRCRCGVDLTAHKRR